MSILLVGCGYWGNNWAKTLAKLDLLEGVCDPRPTIQAELKQRYPDVRLWGDLSAALSETQAHAVVLATPVPTHYEMAQQCLESGRSVLVEKPLTLDPAEALSLVTLAEESQLTLAVGHLLLYQPALLELKRIMAAGELGEILGIQSTRINLGKVRNEENVWWSLAPHDLSIVSMLLDEPLSVQQAHHTHWLKRPQLSDAVTANLVSASGVPVNIQVNWLSPVKRHETMVIGSHKIAIFEDTEPTERKLKLLDYNLKWDDQIVSSLQGGQTTFVAYPPADDDLLTLQAKAFYQSTQDKGYFIPNNGRNGLQVVQLLSQVQAIIDQASSPTVSFAVRN